ncbi:hypothetical protein T440DRAFT_473188 [Plenodomus tracheiphilus IPT5]|uniref:Uncharacterized protein n=1 Tax=Plenodomus tracheiphilus IPT5 TaxID=1408161 RepID=A0A6A7AQU5_9PLEO|nr:hypothetical protein T440DRAFT_473188 [Plenodomus tracheiphilus IPT5]
MSSPVIPSIIPFPKRPFPKRPFPKRPFPKRPFPKRPFPKRPFPKRPFYPLPLSLQYNSHQPPTHPEDTPTRSIHPTLPSSHLYTTQPLPPTHCLPSSSPSKPRPAMWTCIAHPI